MTPTAREVIARRRAERQALLGRAEAFTADLDPSLGVRAVAVFGSVARGDFSTDSDIDVLVVADRVPERPADRLAAVGVPRAGVEAVVWTPAEWAAQRRRRDPIAADAEEHGVWLVGGPDLPEG